jgi:hypothetical protein
MKKDTSILSNIFPGSVGLSNPPSSHKQQMPPSPELKRKFSGDNVIKRPVRPQRTIIESTILPVSNNSNTTRTQIFSTTAEIVRFIVCHSICTLILNYLIILLMKTDFH